MLLRKFPDRDQFLRLAQSANVVPVCAEILADTQTPVSLLRAFYQEQGPIFLFESVEGGERWGRYSFLGTAARTHIRVFRDEVVTLEDGESRRIAHHGDPLAVLKELMAGYRPAEMSELPRFWGGMVGYLTYEMVSFFENIPNQFPAEKPLAHFIVPSELLVFDNIRHTLLVIAPAFTEDARDAANGLETVYESARERIESMLARMERPAALSTQASATQATLATPVDAELFRSKVRCVKDHIVAGDIIQAVISQPFVWKRPPDLWSLYRSQRYVNPSPYLFFLNLGNLAMVGSSPETMVRLENRVANLRPIAGTRPRGVNEQEDRALASELLADEKERAEHLMLVDLGRNDLGRVAEIGTVQVTDLMVVERYSHVMHLVSNITCDLSPEADAWSLLRSTFPAGTLSGAPKVRAMEIISEMEEAPRGAYGGAVGYISFSGNMDMAITIRTACVEDGKLTVRAGAGIVADSEPETERLETVNKARAIERALALAAGGGNYAADSAKEKRG